MSTKVLVNGAFGKMGLITVKAISEHPELELVGQTGHGYDLKAAISDSGAEVVVDFTHPDAVFQNTLNIIESNARPVIGTSGLTPAQVQLLRDKCASAKLGGIIAPNFSVGAILLLKCAKQIVNYMSHAEIIEMHHETKVDSPSGTALHLAETLTKEAPYLNEPQLSQHQSWPPARGTLCNGVPIHSVRLPGLLAHQQIIFGELGETLSLRHDTLDRQCFMPGVCLACQKVMELNSLIFGLEEIL